MIIYGALLIPVIVAFILYKYFHRKVAGWEFFVPLLASLILTISMKAIIEFVQVSSKEYWGSFVKKVEYYEEWNEYISKTCTKDCGKDCTITYDCSYVKHHPASWQIVTTTEELIPISKGQYAELKNNFGNQTFVELNRNSYTIDGDKYCSVWKGDSVNAVPTTTEHTYENRIKAADQSVFHFEKVKEEDVKRYSLKEYPKIFENYKLQAVIGDSTEDAINANKKLSYVNGLLGHKKEVRIFVLIFKNQPIEAGFYQEWYWSGANMNEFVICIGIDGERNVKWCKPISWTRNETLKAQIKNFVQSQTKLNICEIVDFSQKQIEQGFERLNFKEFDYLTVEPPLWAVILTYLVTIAANIGVSIWVVKNEF